jgi:hypothetical protein
VQEEEMETYRRLEDLVVYQKRCRLHIEIGERTLEKQLPESDRRWPNSSVQEDGATYGYSPLGFLNPDTLNPEP